MKLIDVESIKSAKYHALPYTHIHPVGVDVQAYEMGWNDALDAVIENAPTVDAEPVKHGHWIYKEHRIIKDDAIGFYLCSECGHANWIKEDNYCPCCGAKMDEEVNEDGTLY